jgi:mono/diheme cytochrome c family protein
MSRPSSQSERDSGANVEEMSGLSQEDGSVREGAESFSAVSKKQQPIKLDGWFTGILARHSRCQFISCSGHELRARRKATMNILKWMTLTIALTVGFAGYGFRSGTTKAAPQDQFDAPTTYKAKCAACHGPAAEKRFDASIADAELLQAVLKGKKAEKPPNMPAYEEKGITEDQAKALVAYMKSLKQ